MFVWSSHLDKLHGPITTLKFATDIYYYLEILQLASHHYQKYNVLPFWFQVKCNTDSMYLSVLIV